MFITPVPHEEMDNRTARKVACADRGLLGAPPLTPDSHQGDTGDAVSISARVEFGASRPRECHHAAALPSRLRLFFSPVNRMPRPLVLLALTLASAAPAGGGAVHSAPDPYSVERLAEDVYAVIRQVPTTAASDANVLIVVGDDGVLVVDSGIYPASAREVIGEIRGLTSKPVRWLVNTHFHSDHHYGNEEYVKAWPAVEIIAHPETRRLIVEEDIPSLVKNIATDYPAAIAQIRTRLDAGTAANGDTLTTERREALRRTIGMYEFFLADVKDMRQVPATRLVSDSLVLGSLRQPVVIKWIGRGNTPGDLIVHLPREGIVATGDLVVSPIPFAFGSFIADWPGTLRVLRATGATQVVPGHGLVMKDWRYVERLEALLAATWTQVERAVAAGADSTAVRRGMQLDSFREEFAGVGDAARSRFERLFVDPAVGAAFAELRPRTTRQ